MAITAPITYGTTTLDGTEQELYQDAGYEPLAIFLDFSGLSAGDVIYIRTYGKVLPTGAFIQLDRTPVIGDDAIADGDYGYKSIFFDLPYGIKWTVEQASGGAFDVPWLVTKVV